MSTNEAAQAWDNLMEVLACDDGLSDEEVLRDLRDSGVDMDSFLKRIGDTVRQSIQAQRRQQAGLERLTVEEKILEVRQRVLRFPLETIRQMAMDAEVGKFGSLGQELAIACRNKQEKEPTEAELRALVEDILLTTGTQPET